MEKKIIVVTDGNEDLLNTLIEKGILQLADEEPETIDPDQQTLFDEDEAEVDDEGEELEDDDGEDFDGEDEDEPEDEEDDEEQILICEDMLEQVEDDIQALKYDYDRLVRDRMYIHVMRDMPQDISHMLNCIKVYDRFIELDVVRRKLENEANMIGFISEFDDEGICSRLIDLKDQLHDLETCMTPIMAMMSIKCGMLFDPDSGFAVTIEDEDDEENLKKICNKALSEAKDMLDCVAKKVNSLPEDDFFGQMFVSTAETAKDACHCMENMSKIIDTEMDMAQALTRINFIQCFTLDGESEKLDDTIDQINDLNSVLVPLKAFMDEKFLMEFDYNDGRGFYTEFMEEDED